ncbi:hypothetical protein LTR85_005705 [Meristemomyces frigidus]|nr:hypothetical protein LTR85_005705 [Meristemomyces frigidus]
MLYSNGLRRSFGALRSYSLYASTSTRRGLHYDGRNRLSNFWTPTQAKNKSHSGDEDGHDLLMRAGFLRQAHSGIFHLLPLGLRVQDKIERLIDKHMLKLGASKVSLSSLSSEELWQRSGRLEGRGSEFFRLQDRKEAKYLLSPTHEEEITTIVANAVHSYKDLPLRLYQVSRKYRDEARPRQGLLRGREFIMKDLYTFDLTEEQARQTYEAVRKAYSAFLDELTLPYLVASADSGNMGGKLSHEYHFASGKGEDIVIGCDTCDYSINEELYIGGHVEGTKRSVDAQVYQAVSKDRKELLQVLFPPGTELNLYAVKALFPALDSSVEDAVGTWLDAAKAHGSHGTRILLADPRVAGRLSEHDSLSNVPIASADQLLLIQFRTEVLESKLDGRQVSLTKAQHGEACPACSSGHLSLQKAVEIGHTFHLGTRYSEPLDLTVLDANNKQITVFMGCHGIGVSRIIGAVASLLADKKGLNWPMAVAPFGAMVVSTSGVPPEDVHAIYDELSTAGVDVAIDDRERPMGWKLNDADVVGYPFIVILGKGWAGRRMVELQCRKLGIKEDVGVKELPGKIAEYTARL